MADYINTNILCQAYIHIEKDLDLISSAELEKIRVSLAEFTQQRAYLFLHPDASVKIDFEEGSIKNRITVMGSLFLLFQGIAMYKDFRESIPLLYNDAKRMSEYLISESMFIFQARSGDSVRIEARVGIIGSLNKILVQIESAERIASIGGDISFANRRLGIAIFEIQKLINNLKTDEDLIFTKEGFLKIAEGLPVTPRKPLNGNHSVTDTLAYDERRRKIIKLLK